MDHNREIKRIVRGTRTIDGAGVRLMRVLGSAMLCFCANLFLLAQAGAARRAS